MPRRKRGRRKNNADDQQIVSGTEALELLRRLEAIESSDKKIGTALDTDTLLKLLQSDRPCGGALSQTPCKIKNSNPNCLCNLIPPPTGSRRTGLWAKNLDLEKALGPDPNDDRRNDAASPVGLRNLGNTCYANSVLQCLFANEAFRSIIYAAGAPNGPLATDDIISALRNIFVLMQCGPSTPVDPGPLIRALNLDHAVQQDGQEFMKLFLTLLEQKLDSVPKLRNELQTLFRGFVGYDTICQKCGQKSESSSRSDSYYELDIPVQGFKSLEASLASLLGQEMLNGDNQYFCENCMNKQDATRQLQVRSLPPLLCLSLRRFVFDLTKLDRVKVTDKMSFPLEISSSSFVSNNNLGMQFDENNSKIDDCHIYDLEAILIHKGASAQRGHYVAHIKVGKSSNGEGGSWWRFDDESVEIMLKGPLSSSDHGKSTPSQKNSKEEIASNGLPNENDKQKEKKNNSKGTKRKKQQLKDTKHGEPDAACNSNQMLSVENELDQRCTEVGQNVISLDSITSQLNKDLVTARKKRPKVDPKEIVSSNAYMLLYRRRGIDLSAVHLGYDNREWLQECCKKLEKEFDERCRTYQSAIHEAEKLTLHRREEVRTLLEKSTEEAKNDSGCFVSLQWLLKWVDSDAFSSVPPIDNACLLCPHHRLDPSKSSLWKRVSSVVYSRLVQFYTGGPELKVTDTCSECLKQKLVEIIGKEDSEDDRERYVNIAAELEKEEEQSKTNDRKDLRIPEADNCVAVNEDFDPITCFFYVSRSWLAAWRRRSGKSMGMSSPTDAISCPHGNLLPDFSGINAKRIAIPEHFWRYLQRNWSATVAMRKRRQRMRTLKGENLNTSATPCQGKTDGDSKVSGENLIDLVNDSGKPNEKTEDVVILNSESHSEGECRDQVVGAEIACKCDDANFKSNILDSRESSQLEQEACNQSYNLENKFSNEEGIFVVSDKVDSNQEESKSSSMMQEFPRNTIECQHCLQELKAAQKMTEDLRDRKEFEQAVLGHLMHPEMMQLVPNNSYRLIPRSFMTLWRDYLCQSTNRNKVGSGKSAVSSMEPFQPPDLAKAISSSLVNSTSDDFKYMKESYDSLHACFQEDKKDGRNDNEVGESVNKYMLAYPPPQVINRRGRWVLAGDSEFWEVLSVQDWQAFISIYISNFDRKEDPLHIGINGIEAKFVVEDSNYPHEEASPCKEDKGTFSVRTEEALRSTEKSINEGDAELIHPTYDVSTTRNDDVTAMPQVQCNGHVGEEIQNPQHVGDRNETQNGNSKTKNKKIAKKSHRNVMSNSRNGNAKARFVTNPPVSLFTVHERNKAIRAAQLTYKNKEVMVEIVLKESEARISSIGQKGSLKFGDVSTDMEDINIQENILRGRKSRRSRKNRAPVVVDSTTTISEFKLRIFQELGVHPNNIRVFVRGSDLDEIALRIWETKSETGQQENCQVVSEDNQFDLQNQITMADCEVFPGQEIRVIDTQIHDPDDFSGVFDYKQTSRSGPEGFGGTALSGLSAPASFQ